MTMSRFYSETLERFVRSGLLRHDMSILAVCASFVDREVLHELGFMRVTISNLDTRLTGNEFAPYSWSLQDVEQLQYEDNAFDFCIVHDGLHHCRSPHRGLLEMYRVARKGILVIEPRDTFLVRIGVLLRWGQEYEVAAVAGNSMHFGGVSNTQVPNFIYRWTEREVEKAIRSYVPWGNPKFHYVYALRVPEERLQALKNRFVVGSLRSLLPVIRLFTTLFPRQSNGFAVVVEKPDPRADLHGWLTVADGQIRVDPDWVRRRYKRAFSDPSQRGLG